MVLCCECSTYHWIASLLVYLATLFYLTPESGTLYIIVLYTWCVKEECWNFLLGSISGGTWAPFNTIFKVQSPKFQKSMFLVSSGTCVIGMKYLYVDRAKNFFSKMLRFQHQGYQMKALLKVDEEFQISDTSWHHFFIWNQKNLAFWH